MHITLARAKILSASWFGAGVLVALSHFLDDFVPLKATVAVTNDTPCTECGVTCSGFEHLE
jgi:hypothetical protein